MSVRKSVRTSVPPRGPSEAGPGLSGVGPGLSKPVLPAQGQPLRGLGQPLRGLRGGRTYGQTYGRTDVWMDIQIPPVLQDFIFSGSFRSRCPSSITATITKYQSRARVPMTISCLWPTGFLCHCYFLTSQIKDHRALSLCA